MSEPNSNYKPLLKRVFQFERIATIIGFVVDTITLISILLALNLENKSLTLPNIVTPGLAYGLWFITCYTYLAYLHYWWEKNRLEKGYHEKFSTFLLADLILRFRSPLALFPAFALIIILIALLVSNLAVLVPVSLFIGLPLATVFIVKIGSTIDALRDEERKNKSKQLIDKNWISLKKRIKQELENKQWIDSGDLSDIAQVWEIGYMELGYAFAKYVFENATVARYAYVCGRSDKTCVSGGWRVLINLQNLDQDIYYYRDTYY